MLSKGVDAFEDAATDEAVERERIYGRARRLLDEQAEALMRSDVPDAASPGEVRHSAYNPHRRPLSSAARRLIRAYEELEEAAQD